MIEKYKRNINNILFTVWANGISTIISIVLSLLIPKVFSVSEYGMWQLYSFYITYAGLLHLGWPDGVYLQYGGVEYDKLSKQYLCNQFWTMNVFECLLSIVIVTITIMFAEPELHVILVGFSICFLVNSARVFILLVYQATNRIKEYSRYLKLDKFFFFALTILGILAGVRKYQYLIIFDLFGKLMALFASIGNVKDFVLIYPKVFSYQTIKDAIKNISIGSKLTFGGLATGLVIAVLRQCIQIRWGVEVFAKISFTLNISSIIMIFVNTIGQVLFPMLRRIEASKYRVIFENMRTLLSGILLIFLSVYFLIYPLLCFWLPKYVEGLQYMALLFPVYIFESKSALLYTAFFKTIRRETWILSINLITLLFCAVTVPLSIFYYDNLLLAVLFYIASTWIRNVISDIYLSSYMCIPCMESLVLDSIVVLVFMYVAWNINLISGILFYAAVLVIYFILQGNRIKSAVDYLLPLK